MILRIFIRNLLVILPFFTLFFFSLPNSKTLSSWSELVKKGSRYYEKETNEPFTGVLKNFFPSGKLSVLDNFKDGKQHGEYISYHQNGKILMKGKFKEGKQHGEWSEYHKNGELYWKLKYIDGKSADGLFQMFYPNGKLESEVTFKNGKPITNWLYFDEAGKKEKSKVYENGIFIYEKNLK